MRILTSLAFWILGIYFLLNSLSLNISSAEVTKEQFQEVGSALVKAYPSLKIIVNNENKVGIDFWWNQNNRHASYSAYVDGIGNTTHYLFFFGGIARIPEMTQEGVALILCHELGHGVAGPPFKSGTTSSVEGQSDFFATSECLPKVLLNLAIIMIPAPQDPLNLCSNDLCRHLFVGIQSQIALLKVNSKEVGEDENADFEIQDPTIVNEINTDPIFYPSLQCRLDTLIRGALHQERPRCWWK